MDDFELIDIIESYLANSRDRNCSCAYEACEKLKARLDKLHFYEYVFFNGRDSNDARRIKSCTNDEREFIKLDLEDI